MSSEIPFPLMSPVLNLFSYFHRCHIYQDVKRVTDGELLFIVKNSLFIFMTNFVYLVAPSQNYSNCIKCGETN